MSPLVSRKGWQHAKCRGAGSGVRGHVRAFQAGKGSVEGEDVGGAL